jgi:hypothetical protein
MAQVDGVMGSRRTTLLWARGWRRGLGDNDCAIDDITSSGQGTWRRAKGLDCGRERQRGDSGEDSTTAWRLQGGLNDGMSSEEVDDGVGSRKIFDGKFWQLDDISESLRGLGFTKSMQWFIYRRITVAMGGYHQQPIAKVIRIFIAPF